MTKTELPMVQHHSKNNNETSIRSVTIKDPRSDEILTVGDGNDAASPADARSGMPSRAVSTFFKDEKDGLTLRWSRLVKQVQVKDVSVGLMRGSIASPTPSSNPSEGPTTEQAKQEPQPSSGPVMKTILSKVSGSAEPGKVLAMMGPSGSGKTSLLNCLSGRTSYESGVVSLNGHVLNTNTMKRFMSKIAYVRQADIFFQHLTVRDQLGYTAFLRLPQAWPKQKKLDEVERIITSLRLTKVAESKIQMLSGGEKKRVNIGTELLTDPSCLLLDEPTSGLDSTSAVALMRMLQRLARTQNKTVITSIHQPTSALFRSFDRILMLAEGHSVYFGTPRESLPYLRGQNLACPDGYNAADHWMDLLVQDSAMADSVFMDATEMGTIKDEGEDTAEGLDGTDLGVTEHTDGSSDEGQQQQQLTQRKTQSKPPMEKHKSAFGLRRERIKTMKMTTRQQLIEAWDNEAVAEQLDMSLIQTTAADTDRHNKASDGEKIAFKKYNTSWGAQYSVLVHRALKNSRSAIFTPINLIKSAALGIIAGLLWFQMDYTESTVFDRSSYFFFTMTYWVFDAMFNALMAFPSEREVILKERSSGSYHLSAYFMAKTTSEMPTRLALPAIYMAISFWLAGISTRFDLFLFSTFISLLSVVAGEAIGLMVGASIYDMEKAMTFMTVVSLSLMLLGGFFVENVPDWLSWGKFLSPFKYSFDASRQLVFDRDVPCDGSGALEDLCGGLSEGFVDPKDVIEFLDIQGSVGFNVGLLLVVGLFPRYIAYTALRFKKEGER